jgi:thiosulfate/3-mercaptopyruvate sulfurtransferase
MSNLIEAAGLATRLHEPDLRIIDARFELGDPDAGRAAYASGHIPGAVHADLARDLSGAVEEHGGRHPLPAAEQLAEMFGRKGISEKHEVVVYDDTTGMFASRVWWTLRYLGHRNVRVLDGGLTAWRAAGLPLSTEKPDWPAVTFHSNVQSDMIVDRDWLLQRLGHPGLHLLDARSPERFSGEVALLDPLPGHIPGARNFPYTGNLSGGKLKDASALRERFAALAGASSVVSYCGSGVSGTSNLLALEEAGVTGGRLYVGSWSDWSSHADAPVETGPGPETET